MKWIDALAGVPLCFLASPLAVLYRVVRPPPRLESNPPDTILFIKLLGMGSIILTTPTVKAMGSRFPGARRDLLTFAANKPVADALGVFDAVHVLRTKNFFVLSFDTLRFLGKIWCRRYAIVMDFEFFSKFSALLSFLTLAPHRTGFSSPLVWRGWLQTEPVLFNHYRHITDNFLGHAKVLGVQATDKTLAALRSGPDDQRVVDQLLCGKGVPAEAPLFLVNVNASDMCLERRWPITSFDQLLSALKARYPKVWFLLVGAPSERSYVQQVIATLKDSARIVDLAGCLSLPQLADLMKRSRLLITSESGPLHFAQSLDVPSVTLFGPGPPTLFGPLGQKHRTLYAAVDCSPCLNYYALTGPTCGGDNICMKYILPADVERVIQEHLEHLRAAV